MAVQAIPEGYHTITPYLVVRNVEALIAFMQRAFDATVCHCTRRPDGKIMHADALIGGSHVMMGEASDQWPAQPCSLYMYVPDVDAVFDRAVAAGGTAIMPPADQFYGDRHGGLIDPVGIQWWIATHIEDVSPEELTRRAQEHMKK